MLPRVYILGIPKNEIFHLFNFIIFQVFARKEYLSDQIIKVLPLFKSSLVIIAIRTFSLNILE